MSSPLFRRRRQSEHTHQKLLDRGTLRIAARQKGDKEGKDERRRREGIGFEEAIHRETGWDGKHMRGSSVQSGTLKMI